MFKMPCTNERLPQANVYHAVTPERRHLALKIYKTSILVFKDRDRYVSGEYRFRRGYRSVHVLYTRKPTQRLISSRHNPRKMVRVWAEKEMRNLKRLHTAGIRCPEPLEVRENVLVMTFIGDADGWYVAVNLSCTAIHIFIPGLHRG